MTAEEIAATEGRLRTGARPGPKRRPRNLVETGVMLDKAERQALDAIAEEAGKSRSALIREAVRKVWLKKGPEK